MKTSTKPLGSLSLDLDNQWSYMKTHGDGGWQSFPSYLDIVVPRVLDFFRQRNLTLTFFVVGQDAALDQNRAALRALSDAGHEIGNHSFSHEQWLHLYTEQQIEDDLSRAEAHIERVTGQKLTGFRGPGYSFSRATLEVLKRRSYTFDASTFPTYLGPLARMYYFATAKLSLEEKRERAKLFGTLQDGLRPTKPFRWQLDAGELLEIPVTTMPVFKIPFHASYILYLSLYSRALAMLYYRWALGMCRWRGVQPSLLLHPLDFLGGDDIKELSFFPAMRVPSAKKLDVMSEILRLYTTNFNVVTMRQHAEACLQDAHLPQMKPSAMAS